MSINPSGMPGYVPPAQPTPQPTPPAYTQTPPAFTQGPPTYVPPAYAAPPAPSSKKIPILIGAVIALVAANIYLFWQLNNTRTDIAKMQTSIMAEIDKVREASAVTSQSHRRTVEALRDQLDAERRQARMAVGQAKEEALKRVDETKSVLEAEQQKAQQETRAQITEVQKTADTANTKIGEVGTEVTAVKTDLGSTKTTLEKTIADLKRTSGDLDGHSVLIATNAKELAALRELGERNYIEFKIHKAKQTQKVGDVMVALKKTDPKKNRYTIELTVDDKTVEKRDRTVNEPLQFMTSKARQPYEIVVNDVRKDEISGYLSVPKVQSGRS